MSLLAVAGECCFSIHSTSMRLSLSTCLKFLDSVSSSSPVRVMYRAPVAYLKIRVGEVLLWSVLSKGLLAILATAQSSTLLSEKSLHILRSATSQLKVPGVTVKLRAIIIMHMLFCQLSRFSQLRNVS